MPPPPPEPPPLPRVVHAKSSNGDPPPDRNALLSQIRKGARLKKSETNDRSGPLIDGKATKPSNASKASADYRPNGPVHAIPPGGLFAQGIPKLRPTFPRSSDVTDRAPVLPSNIRSNNSHLDNLRVGQVTSSRSQPPSPVSKPRQPSGAPPLRTSSYSEKNSYSGNPNFPDDVNIKGPAPPPPPANQKPNFKVMDSSDDIQQSSDARRFAVRRSASQTSLGQRPRLSRPPPNVKPPPPPKCPMNAPPPPPSKPPNILRRQSFGIGESHSSRFASAKLTVAASANSTPKPIHKTIGPPPPPPRNNSAPNDLNQMVGNPMPSNSVFKMNTAPPPPPPNRTAMVLGNRAVPLRPPPPRAPAPPPPPQHRLACHPAPPSQMKAVPPVQHVAPPPPARISSIKPVTSDFEGRFFPMFCGGQNLPKPERFTNCEKHYPSKANLLRLQQNPRRQPPPPPPPQNNNVSSANPVRNPLQKQLESCIFPNNLARC